MKEKLYTVAGITVSILRAVLGLAVMIPTVVICAVLDRFSAKLLINAGDDRDDLEDAREDLARDLNYIYRKYSDFS